MSDLFHDRVPFESIRRVFAVMRRADRHRFQVLTKGAERLARLAPELDWPENIWMGVSFETDRYRHRIDALRAAPARVRFLSLEPLLGPLRDLDLEGIDWVIVGGESGPRARPMDAAWVTALRDQCRGAVLLQAAGREVQEEARSRAPGADLEPDALERGNLWGSAGLRSTQSNPVEGAGRAASHRGPTVPRCQGSRGGRVCRGCGAPWRPLASS